jgi:hypothetical protein
VVRVFTVCLSSISGEHAALRFGAKLPLGNSNFEGIITGKMSFVDKSLLITEFCDGDATVSLVLRPRRFGKTTNLSMLYYFFQVPPPPSEEELKGFAHLSEKELEAELKRHADLEISKRRILFDGLKITTERQDVFDEYFCKHPVIFITLKVRCFDYRLYC